MIKDSTTGFILAGIGDVNKDGERNFFVVDNKTPTSDIEDAFNKFTKERNDIAIVLINQHIADKIRPIVDKYMLAFPAVLEIPSKDHPYGSCPPPTNNRPFERRCTQARPKTLWRINLLLSTLVI